jgi:hypothetical protein
VSHYPVEPVKHVWTQGKDIGIAKSSKLYDMCFCKNCGVLRRPDGGNGPCKGVIKVSLR